MRTACHWHVYCGISENMRAPSPGIIGKFCVRSLKLFKVTNLNDICHTFFWFIGKINAGLCLVKIKVYSLLLNDYWLWWYFVLFMFKNNLATFAALIWCSCWYYPVVWIKSLTPYKLQSMMCNDRIPYQRIELSVYACNTCRSFLQLQHISFR